MNFADTGAEMVLDCAAITGRGLSVVDMDLRDEIQVGMHTYGVTAKSTPGDETQPESLAVEFTGADQDGRVVAEGNLLIALDGITDAGRFLTRMLEGIAALSGQRAQSRGRASPAPNAGRPWTDELSDQLRSRWLGSAGTDPPEVLGELAQEFGRSRSSIRAQLARVGCDPDVPGRALVGVPSHEAALVTAGYVPGEGSSG